jgi:hypothetical protein
MPRSLYFTWLQRIFRLQKVISLARNESLSLTILETANPWTDLPAFVDREFDGRLPREICASTFRRTRGVLEIRIGLFIKRGFSMTSRTHFFIIPHAGLGLCGNLHVLMDFHARMRTTPFARLSPTFLASRSASHSPWPQPSDYRDLRPS